MGSAGAYAFGDSDVAARRLGLVAEMYESSTRAYLARLAVADIEVAIDLGCGPGFTTALIGELTGARRVVGIDGSESFLDLARARNPSPRYDFVRHDVTVAPLPGSPADLIFCRLLLAHLPDPCAQVERWVAQLSPNGRLAVDEVEWITSSVPVLQRYEEAVVAVVGSRGALMYAGPEIASLDGDGWGCIDTDVVEILVDPAFAAHMFALNLSVWRRDADVESMFGRDELDDIAADLATLATQGGSGTISWGQRHSTFARI